MTIRRSVFLALTAVLLTLMGLWFTNRAVTPKTASWEDVLTEADKGGYRLITTTDLAKKYLQDDSNLLLVDTRQEWEFFDGTDLVGAPTEGGCLGKLPGKGQVTPYCLLLSRVDLSPQ
jgi:hypothetical protein